ncbi:protein kinase [Streptomyces sp. TRM43335]|uniref:non-specific serine/threonine protein kinase n=1 Tax=Streptomyces taklimakanensis TaxID=2569853 RepID=A0A6G2BCH3_9ACTN|nr:serine/threonine-protein kinase [Streptomyces taklimakanensis]MTE19981.1 protein kinase [Streptomyces taklimakanensis]
MGEIFAGRYELVDPIGRGGVGAVWRTWDHRRRRYVAAKVLQQSDAHTLLRFVREQALRIDHPHVLAPMSWAADDDKVLFTMDLVRGGSLAHLIGDYGPLPPAYVCVLLDQLLSGLAAVHAEDVVHRDIKPANVLLDATGTGRPHLRLSDFGIAMRKGEPRLTEADYVVGTPGYFAPEQLLGAEPDFPADLYAVGLVAVYLLTGRKPDSQALVEAYTRGTPPAPRDVPEPLWQVLGTLLHPDPDHRFRTATGVRKALASAVELLPEDTAAEQEAVEVFDQVGPLPPGFGPDGPDGPGRPRRTTDSAASRTPEGAGSTGRSSAVPPSPPPPAPAHTPPSPSDTGSFPLPPPVREVSRPPRRPPAPPVPPSGPERPWSQPQPQPQSYAEPHRGTYGSPPPTGTPPTRPHTTDRRPAPGYAPAPHAPTPAPAAPPAPAPPPPGRGTPGRVSHRARPSRKPGPPPAVALPVLLLALLCLAVGVWALSRS